MIDPVEAGRDFDLAFGARAPAGCSVRPERESDQDFLRTLFMATYVLRDVLPGPLVAQQADLHLAAFSGNYPDAMRRILTGAAGPIGRIIVDWTGEAGASHCVDVAVHPAHGGRGLGTALLQSWIEVASRRGLACTLNVAPENPARALYARLGFREETGELDAAGVAMRRPPGP